MQLASGVLFKIVAGSVLDFRGDAFVNAANEGCVGGFGIDEVVNRSGGARLKEARKLLGGCRTGSAKVTESFDHTSTRWIVHAVGPVYRVNKLKQGFDEADDGAAAYMRSLDPKLVHAYRSSLDRCEEVNARSIGFCILSAGVFRGARPLHEVVQIGIRTLVHALSTVSPNRRLAFESVAFFAFSDEEQELARSIGEEVAAEVAAGGDGRCHELVEALL